MYETAHTSNGRGRGRGRGRPRGCGRGSRAAGKFENDPDIMNDDEKENLSTERLDNIDEPEDLKENIESNKSKALVHGFDLNMDMDENGKLKPPYSTVHSSSPTKPFPETKHSSDKNEESKTELSVASPIPKANSVLQEKQNKELPGWSFVDIEKMDIDTIHLANFKMPIDEDEEDYDEEQLHIP